MLGPGISVKKGKLEIFTMRCKYNYCCVIVDIGRPVFCREISCCEVSLFLDLFELLLYIIYTFYTLSVVCSLSDRKSKEFTLHCKFGDLAETL
jgi:hypothetical protein